MNERRFGARLHGAALGTALTLLLSACGGGGGGGSSTPPGPTVTPLPSALNLTAPTGGDSATEMQFASNATTSGGLRFAWDFGDGTTSAEASPKHAFSKGGDYDVVLKVTNESGASIDQRIKVSVTNLANVKGLVCSGANAGGWCWQQPRPTGNGRNDSLMISATSGFTVGDNGEVFRTTDAGATWTQQSSGLNTSLRQVVFSSATDGWIVGDYGALLRTSDGGATWTLSKIQDIAGGYYYYGSPTLKVVDANTAIYWSTYSAGRFTKDGGKTWAALPVQPTTVTNQGVLWVDNYNGHLYRSTDFGLSTTDVLDYSETDGSYITNHELRVLDERTVFLSTLSYRYDSVNNRYIYKSTLRRSDDGGTSWTRTVVSSVNGAATQYQFFRVFRASSADQILLAMVDSQTYRSEDGGLSWTSISLGYNTINANEVLVLDAQTMVTAGYQGVYRSEDTGKTWTKVTIAGMQPYDNSTGLRQISGDLLSVRDPQGQVYLSADRGKTWTTTIKAAPSSYSQSVPIISFLDGKHGFMLTTGSDLLETKDGGLSWQGKLPGLVSGGGDLNFVDATTGWMLLSDGRLYKTTDGGATWGAPQTVRSGGLSIVRFVDANRGWGRQRYNSGSFVLSTDGGQTWSDLTMPTYDAQALYLGADQRMVAYGSNGLIALTTDGGKTWDQRFTGTSSTFYKVAAQDASTLWAVGTGGQVRRSADAGSTWVSVDLGLLYDLRDIVFASSKVGWIVGNQGTILATVDGGKTWTRQAANTQRNLVKIIATDSKTAWISGEYGTLIATGNGGN